MGDILLMDPVPTSIDIQDTTNRNDRPLRNVLGDMLVETFTNDPHGCRDSHEIHESHDDHEVRGEHDGRASTGTRDIH